ncbi:MAG: hypothetical protein WKH64_00480 [Chloroflexia bacterium]
MTLIPPQGEVVGCRRRAGSGERPTLSRLVKIGGRVRRLAAVLKLRLVST